MTPIIGMTEAGDAGMDLAWLTRLNENKSKDDNPLRSRRYAGAILITKAGHRQAFQDAVRQLKLPCIIHFGITGWGKTPMEPNTPTPEDAVQSIRRFIDNGFPAKNCVIRIDPVIPTPEGLDRAATALKNALSILPDVSRIRISIYDDYHNSREEMIHRGYAPVDNITKWKSELERRPTKKMVDDVARCFMETAPGRIFELCAEPELAKAYPNHFVWCGCLSETDLAIMSIQKPDYVGTNGQNRFGCRCLTMKTELLDKKHRCPNNCAYCYWGRACPSQQK